MIEPSVKTLLEGLAALRDLIACHDSERASALCEELLALGVKAAEVATCHVCGGAATKLCAISALEARLADMLMGRMAPMPCST
jgi:hypothetical protein